MNENPSSTIPKLTCVLQTRNGPVRSTLNVKILSIISMNGLSLCNFGILTEGHYSNINIRKVNGLCIESNAMQII